ncbi:MAG: FAD-dependent oxidoreductase [Candidatus Eremiobacteraeota bacterium]|nr:FAD-dependent oxidoreductase [Candidatus Eremiobacteraeota bacterium]
MKIAVIGAGINGLSSAWALMRDGHDITVVEQGAIPNPLSSSYDQNRLIRFPYGASDAYTNMVSQAYRAWDLLWADLGETLYARTGTLALARANDSWTDLSAATLARAGIEAKRLSPADVERIFPMLLADDVRYALYLDSGGELFAARIVEALARLLSTRGAQLRENTLVKDVDVDRPRVRLADGSTIESDALVIAAGAWVKRLVPSMASRVTPSRQVVAYVEAPAAYAAHWRSGPMLMDLDGAGFYLVPPYGGTDMKVGDHRFSLQGQPDVDREPAPAEAAAVFEQARRALRDFKDYRIKAARTCFYTVQPEERFLIERLGNAWLVSACSGHGFKFGALNGLAVADGIGQRRTAADIGAYAAGDVVVR